MLRFLLFMGTALLVGCAKDDTNSVYYPRGIVFSSEPSPSNPQNPINPNFPNPYGTLKLSNTGANCAVIVVKGGATYELSAGQTSEVSLLAGQYTYSLLCGNFPNCTQYIGVLKNDKTFTVDSTKTTLLTLNCL